MDKNLEPHQIFNSDQTGINIEIVGKRTLEYTGTKKVITKVISPNNTTHSFTVQLYFSMQEMGKTVLLIFKGEEEAGKIIRRKLDEVLEKCPNVRVEFNKCAKMTDPVMSKWLAQFEKDNANLEKKLLMWDSLSLQKRIAGSATDENYESDENDDEKCRNYECDLRDLFDGSRTFYKVIPGGVTGVAQPLDSRFIIQFKQLYKTFFKAIKIKSSSIDRYLIIKLISVVYNQFTAVNFKSLIEYCWTVCGYKHHNLTQNEAYSKVIDVNLSQLKKCEKCSNNSVSRCAHCGLEFCIDHFILKEMHVHF